jgi:multidrug efflux system membrane fusion protein
VALIEAQEALNQARIEYKGAISLRKKGYNSEAAIAGAKSRLASAKANLSRRQLSIAKLEVRAPFDGIVETVHREIGDYIKPGDGCATVVDMDPILLVGQVSEADVIHLALGQPATGFLRNGESVTGPVSFIGQQNDPATRTYDVEIQLSNPDLKLRSGVTTEIHIPVESILAQKISPALLSLDDLGVLGIRTIDQNNIVNFNPIEILSDAPDGIWVSGLPNRSAIITTGQALVTEGERVDPVFQNRRTLKAESSQSEMPKAEQLPDSGATATAAVMSIDLGLSAN